MLVGCAHGQRLRNDTPIALEPSGGATLESLRPRFTWTLPDGADGAIVEICRDADCKFVEDTIVGRDAGQPGHDLPTVPLFYRVTSTTGGVRKKSRPPCVRSTCT